MEKITVVPPIQIDLSIKQRKKAAFNKRHQLANPVGNYFKIPDKCSKTHFNDRFKCVEIELEDVLEFRAQLYESTEKRDQREFLSNFLVITAPRRRTGQGQVARIMQVYYKIPKRSGTEIPICREMFYAVTGLGRARVNTIVQKHYKKALLEHGDDDALNESNKQVRRNNKTAERDEKLRSIIIQKKEKLLSLAKGTYEEFSKALKDRKRSGGTEENSFEQNSFEQDYDENEFIEEEYIEESYEEEIPEMEETVEEVLVNQLYLESFETCRICLSNDNLLPLYEKLETEEYSYAEMIEYGLQVELPQNDNLPTKLCTSCLDKVKIACNLRNDFIDAQEIIENTLNDCQKYEIPDNKEEDLILSNSYLEDQNQKEQQQEQDGFPLESGDVVAMEQDIDFIEQETDVNEVPTPTEPLPRRNESYENLRPKKCYLCDAEFSITPEDHFELYHNEIELTKCELCEFETEFPWFLNLHYQVHAEDFHLCQNCGKTFEGAKYTVHRSWCGKPKLKNRIYKCSHCDAQYTRSYDLKVHERIHTQEKPYKCSKCPLSFAKRMSLRRHMLKHGVGIKCYCSNCGKGYLQQYELNRHENYCFKKEF